MSISRRHFTAIAAAAAAGGALGLPLPAWARTRRDTTVFEWTRLPGGVMAAMGQGGNAMLFASGGESMLVDCKNAGFGHSLRRESEREGAALKYVINTHHHADHTGGNPAFTADLPVIAQNKAIGRVRDGIGRYRQAVAGTARQLQMSDDPGARKALADAGDFFERAQSLSEQDFMPNQGVENRIELEVGDQIIVLAHGAAGHTDNDMYVLIPRLKVLHTGDLVFNGLHPFFDQTGGVSLAGWIRAVRTLITLCDTATTVIPGHGPVGDRMMIRAQIDYLERTRDGVAEAIKDGRTREEVVEMQFPHFEGLGFEQVRGRALGAIYDELSPSKEVGPSPSR